MPELMTLSPGEVAQLDIDTGLLHEANRSFFHPLGMTLLVEDNNLVLKRGLPEETVHQIMDRDKIMKFRSFSRELHIRRSAMLRFIIQVNSMIAQPQAEHQETTGDLPKQDK